MMYLPRLSLAERNFRWRRVREEMAARGLDALAVVGNDAFFNMGMANFRYLTHIGAPHGNCACVFPLEGEPIVYQAPSHMGYPFNFHRVAQEWVSDIRPFQGARAVAAGLRELGLHESHVGIVGFASALASNMIPHAILAGLEGALPEARISEQTDLVERQRVVKSEEELRMLGEAARLARRTILRLCEVAEPGIPECAVSAAMAHEQVANGGDPHLFNLMTSGPVEGDPQVWHLVHGVEQQTRRPLSEGDLIVCEFHASYCGYLAAAEFSLYLGDPPRELERIHAVAVECLQTYRQVMRPGLALREAWRAVRQPCRASGLDFLELGFHGHGLASPEWPTVVYKEGSGPLGGDGMEDVVLEENMVFGINIDIFDPAWKQNVGVQLGDTVVVKPSGGEFLVQTPVDVFAKGGSRWL